MKNESVNMQHIAKTPTIKFRKHIHTHKKNQHYLTTTKRKQNAAKNLKK